jgi:hypothetical protein
MKGAQVILKNAFSTLTVALFVSFTASSSLAQGIVIDWASKKIVEQPAEIHRGDTVKVSVENVNNIFYDYTVDVQLQSQNNSDDFAALMKVLAGLQGKQTTQVRPANQCPDLLENAQAVLGRISTKMKDPKNNLNPEGRPDAITLDDTRRGWHNAISPELPELSQRINELSAKCADDPPSSDFLGGAYHQFQDLQKKVDGPHVAEGQAEAKSGDVASVRITVTEAYQGNVLAAPVWVLRDPA